MAVWKMATTITDPNLGGTGVNLWHGRTDATITENASLNAEMDWVKTFFTAIAALLPSPCLISYDGVATEVGTGSPRVIEGLTTWSVAASGAGLPMPPANCIVVGWKTGLATRSGRGRTFIGPLKQAVCEQNGTIASANLSTIRTAASALVTSSLAETTPPSALGVWSVKDQLLRDFTGSAVRDKFAVLRSRRD
jgi:hypothetical protein